MGNKKSKHSSVDSEKIQITTEELNKAFVPNYYSKDRSSKETNKKVFMKKVLGYDKAEENELKDHRQKVFKTIIRIVFIVFIVGVLAFTAYDDFFSGKKPAIAFTEILSIVGSNWKYLLLALLFILTNYFLRGFRLSTLCKKLSGKWKLFTCINTAIIGNYFNNVTPLAVGGQPFEIYHLSKHGVNGGKAATIPIAAYFFGQLSFVILGVVGLSLLSKNTLFTSLNAQGMVMSKLVLTFAIIGLSFCLITPIIVVLFCIFPRTTSAVVKFIAKVGNKLKLIKNPDLFVFKTLKTIIQNSQCLKKIAKSPFMLFSTLIISFAESISYYSLVFCSLKLFGFNFDNTSVVLQWVMVCQIAVILYAAVSFIPTPGNSGAADFSFYALFSAVFVSKAGLAFPSMIVWRFLSFYLTLIVGVIYNAIDHRIAKRHEQMKNMSNGTLQ